MKITIDNYEQYVLDFLEGNLTDNEVVTFEAFLEIHPHIQDEIKDVNQFVLIPVEDVVYPNKSTLYRRDRAIIVPFWNFSRMVAAAVAFLVVTTTVFFIWKSSLPPSSMQSSDNQLSITKPEINQRNLPAAGISMPEGPSRTEESLTDSDINPPDLNVMVQQENGSRGKNNARQSSPVLTSGSFDKKVESTQSNLNTIIEPMAKSELPVHRREEDESDLMTPDLGVPLSDMTNSMATTAVSFLPLKSSEITVKNNLVVPEMVSFRPIPESQTYKIHIPGQFLSETWTDISMTNFKKKLIPTFIKNQLNL